MNMMVDVAAKGAHTPHEGMPPLDISGPPVSFFEFWPQRYFYAPMMLYWLWLTLKHGGRFSLPTAANPAFPMGGWIGESNLIEWFWEQRLRGGGRGDRPAAFLQRLARDQAEQGRGTRLEELTGKEERRGESTNAASRGPRRRRAR